MPLIQVEHLSKRYGAQSPILQDVCLSIEAGEWVAIVGASGCGKSTLMHILGFLDQASSGLYRFDGRVYPWLKADQLAFIRSRHIGFVFQAFHLLPRLTVLENVALPLLYQGLQGKAAWPRALKALEELQLAYLSQRFPQQLSGGQQQRVAIARALVTQPTLILADEPTGALDNHTSEAIMDCLAQLNHQQKTIVMVTHNPLIAARCQRVLRLEYGHIQHDSQAAE